ncbi:MAG: phosphoglucomutase/phosphomannomutase family protein [Bacteroidota bacterium]
MAISFGTDGWRGIIADDFTFENVGKVAFATAKYFEGHPNASHGVVVGYDTRFLSREFAERSAQVIGSAGLKAILAGTIVPTPAVSLAVKQFGAAGGVVITASHNPAKYNGFKIKGAYGGPAHPEMVSRVEDILRTVVNDNSKLELQPLDVLEKNGSVERIDLRKLYVDTLKEKLDLGMIERSGIKIIYDVMHGAGMNTMQHLLPEVRQIRDSYNPSFGGLHPEPLEHNLEELIESVQTAGGDIGIATDGDADRIGAVDESGKFVDAHRIFALLLKYLVEVKKWTGEVAKAITVTEMVNKQCAKYGLKLHETPVGFKHICRLMTQREVLIGGEESGGLGVKGHIPERDGIYMGLLLCEIMAVRKMKLGDLVQELMDELGEHHFKRIDWRITPQQKEQILNRFRKGISSIGSLKVNRVDTTDGFKYFVDNGWLLVRASGTEPLFRFYAEADSPSKVEELLKGATES